MKWFQAIKQAFGKQISTYARSMRDMESDRENERVREWK